MTQLGDAEVEIARNAGVELRIEQKRLRKRCTYELAVRQARSLQGCFRHGRIGAVAVLQRAVNQRGAIQRRAGNAAANKATVAKGQAWESAALECEVFKAGPFDIRLFFNSARKQSGDIVAEGKIRLLQFSFHNRKECNTSAGMCTGGGHICQNEKKSRLTRLFSLFLMLL